MISNLSLIFILFSFHSTFLKAVTMDYSEVQSSFEKKQEKGNLNEFKKMETCKNYIEAEIYGLVCDFCSRSIEKTFKKMDMVKSVDINLDNGIVKIFLKKGETMDYNIITQHFLNSGYETNRLIKKCD